MGHVKGIASGVFKITLIFVMQMLGLRLNSQYLSRLGSIIKSTCHTFRGAFHHYDDIDVRSSASLFADGEKAS